MAIYHAQDTPREEFTLDLLEKIWKCREDCIKKKRTQENNYIYDKFENYLNWYYNRDSLYLFKRNQFSSRTSAWNSFIKYFEDAVRGALFLKDKSLFRSSGDDVVFQKRREMEKKLNLSPSNPVSIKIGGTKRRKSKKKTRRKLK